LQEIGSKLEGGQVELGYTESVSMPMKYCVCCHQNITPLKEEGKSFAGMSGLNLTLTIMTCGFWLPAWILMEFLTRTGKAVGKKFQKGVCPQCGNKFLFAGRVYKS